MPVHHIHADNIDRLLPGPWKRCVHLPTEAEYTVLISPANVETSVGTVPARPGDIVLRDEYGVWVLFPEMHARAYKPVER